MHKWVVPAMLWLVLILLWVPRTTAQGTPEGSMTWGVHVTLAPTWFDPGETPGIITPFMFLYALHDALVKPMPDNRLAPSPAESWSESADGLTTELLHQIQRPMYDKVMYTPLFDPAFICASGPRLEISGRGMIPQFAHSGPYEDLQLRKP